MGGKDVVYFEVHPSSSVIRTYFPVHVVLQITYTKGHITLELLSSTSSCPFVTSYLAETPLSRA